MIASFFQQLETDKPINLDRHRHMITCLEGFQQSFGAKQDLQEHLSMIEKEFAGQNSLNFVHAALIVFIRRKINLETNLSRFFKLWNDHEDILIEQLDMRWLVSACDTFADYASDLEERQIATMASLFVNTIKLYETERTGSNDKNIKVTTSSERLDLFEGLTGFMVGNGDMVANLIARIKRNIIARGPAQRIIQELIGRVLQNETIFRRYSEHQQTKHWPDAIAVEDSKPHSGRAFECIKIKPDQKSYILLNDTGRLSAGFHVGTMFASQALRDAMTDRGFTEAGWANGTLGFQKILETMESKPSIVLVNGEGTMHHNAPRAKALLECCDIAHANGIPTALVNTIWQGNSQEMSDLLARIDLVHVRESQSRSMIPSDVETVITPDMSLLHFLRFFRSGTFNNTTHEMGVMDSVAPNISFLLQEFACSQNSPFYAMPMAGLLNSRQECNLLDYTMRYPRLLQARDVKSASCWLVGRFHGLIAALCAGLPVCAVPSNTFKIEAFLADAGLSEYCLLQPNWFKLSAKQQFEAFAELINMQKSNQFQTSRNAYLQHAEAEIQKMFDNIVALAS